MLERIAPYMSLIKLLGVLFVAAGLFFSGMKVEAWKKNEEIAAIKLQQADDREKVLKQSISDLAAASKLVLDNAKSAQAAVRKNDEKLNEVSAEIKKFKPLPVDCKPDGLRQLNLERAIDAANNSISGR